MGKYLNPGNEAFAISVNDDIYVDKTDMLSYINSRIGKKKRYLCVSRPRRFGKSTTAEMLSAYYSRGCDSQKLFQDRKIASDQQYISHLNHYDVIFLNMQHLLSSAKTPTNLIAHLEHELLTDLQNAYPFVKKENISHLPDVFQAIFASRKQPQKGFIFIIDEWDCLFREEKDKKEIQKSYLDFLKDLFKDRSYVNLAYMTGILPIKKYGTHSALNIFDEYSMTNPMSLSEYVGFTELEVKDLCEYYHMNFSEMEKWYDGYRFRKISHIYNPKSVVDALLESEIENYWSRTETFEALQIYLDMNYDGLKDAVISMMGDEPYPINIDTFQNDMSSFHSKDDVLTLLIHLGYLGYNSETHSVYIPNQEIFQEFRNAVQASGWSEVINAIQDSDKLLLATLEMDTEFIARQIEKVHMENCSVINYNDENSLSCIISLAYYSAKKEYRLIRELPAGKGFADIVFIPKEATNNPPIIVELKWNKNAITAIQQIKERHYINALPSYRGEIILTGINYDKKSKCHECIIEKICL